MGLQAHIITPAFYLGAGDPNSVLHVYIACTLMESCLSTTRGHELRRPHKEFMGMPHLKAGFSVNLPQIRKEPRLKGLFQKEDQATFRLRDLPSRCREAWVLLFPLSVEPAACRASVSKLSLWSRLVLSQSLWFPEADRDHQDALPVN